jgi:hypothetical protein
VGRERVLGGGMLKYFSVSVFSLLAFSGIAMAADYDLRPTVEDENPPIAQGDAPDGNFDPASDWFGTAYMGSSALTNNFATANDYVLGRVNAGGKVAYDPAESGLGFQLDLNSNYSDWSWITPARSVSGPIYNAEGIAHATYGVNDNLKLGAYAGYGQTNLNMNSTVISGAYVSMLVGATTAGVEGLYSLSDHTWAQGHIAVTDLNYVGAIASDGTTIVSGSTTDLLSKNLGYGLGGSLHHSFNQNWSARGEAAYTHFGPQILTNSVDLLSTRATVQYAMDSFPVTVAYGLGYDSSSWMPGGNGGFTSDLKFQWMFGDGAPGVRGKMFRTSVLGLTP